MYTYAYVYITYALEGTIKIIVYQRALENQQALCNLHNIKLEVRVDCLYIF